MLHWIPFDNVPQRIVAYPDNRLWAFSGKRWRSYWAQMGSSLRPSPMMQIIRQEAQRICSTVGRSIAGLSIRVRVTLVAPPIASVLLWIVVAYLVHWQQQAALFVAAQAAAMATYRAEELYNPAGGEWGTLRLRRGRNVHKEEGIDQTVPSIAPTCFELFRICDRSCGCWRLDGQSLESVVQPMRLTS